MDFSEEKLFISGVENTRIHIKKIVPRSYNRVFLVFHGLCEHSGRYHNFVRYFLKHNTALYLVDHRGHGLSGGERGSIENFFYFVQDALNALDYVERQENKSTFIIAHSMGALIITYACLLHKFNFDHLHGIVLSSPAYKIKDVPEGFEETVMKINAVLKNFFVRTVVSPEKFINDPSEVEKYKRDKLIVNRVSPKMFNQMIQAIKYCQENIEKFNAPVLLLIAGKDNLVEPGTILNHFRRMRSSDRKQIIYENSFHELFNDLYRYQVFSDIEHWTKERIKRRSVINWLKSFTKKTSKDN